MKPTHADLAMIIKLEPIDAIAYLKRKGFAIGWDWHSVDAETHARAFTVAKGASIDIFSTIRTALVDNLRQGKTLKDFIQDLQPVLEAKGWWGRKTVINPVGEEQEVTLGTPRRLKTIYQTNMQSAYMAGRYKAALEATETHPYWMYVATMDGRTRPSHSLLHGKVFRWDDPVWEYILPPNGYNCRCRFTAMTEAEVKRRGLKVESSEGRIRFETVETGVASDTGEINTARIMILDTKDWKGNKAVFRTDPGFTGGPAHSHILDDVLLEKARQAFGEPAALQELQGTLLNPVRLASWAAYVSYIRRVGKPQGQGMAFAVLQEPELAYVRSKGAPVQSGLVLARDEVIAGVKARRHQAVGNALTLEEWKQLPLRMAQAELVLWDASDNVLIYVLPADDDRVIKVVVRFGKNRYGSIAVDDIASAFKVKTEDIRSGINSGAYLEVRK